VTKDLVFSSLLTEVGFEPIYLLFVRDVDLHFVESPALAPPVVTIDLVAQQQ
jgi:hypothetical protein